MAYIGPMLLGTLAHLTGDAAERRAALAEGEALLAEGSISHNHLWFYREAIEAALLEADYEAVERYAQAFEAYTRPEPLPWADFLIARGRALAAFAAVGRNRVESLAGAVVEQLPVGPALEAETVGVQPEQPPPAPLGAAVIEMCRSPTGARRGAWCGAGPQGVSSARRPDRRPPDRRWLHEEKRDQRTPEGRRGVLRRTRLGPAS